MTLVFTTVIHAFRREHNLTLNEYTICDMIHFLSTSTINKMRGWCYMTKDNMALELNCTKQTVLNLIDRMIEKGFIERDQNTKFLRSTEKWGILYIAGKENIPLVKNNHGKENMSNGKKNIPVHGKKNILDEGKKNIPNKYILDINTNDNNIIEDSIDFSVKNPTLFPEAQFGLVAKKTGRKAPGGGPKISKYGHELEMMLSIFNDVLGTRFRSFAAIEDNYSIWREIYQPQEIEQAIRNIPLSGFWSDKMTLVILFRIKGKGGEKVDYIGEMLNVRKDKTNHNKNQDQVNMAAFEYLQSLNQDL